MTDSAPLTLAQRVTPLLSSLARIADQGLVSGGTFVTHLMAARALPERDYGLLALLLLAVLFLNFVHSSLIVQPISVRAGSVDSTKLRPLAKVSLLVTLGFALPSAIVLALVANVLGRLDLAPLAIALAAAWQLQESLRRVLLCAEAAIGPLLGDGLRYLGQAAAVGILAHLGLLSLEAILGSMVAFACLGAVAQWLRVLSKTDGDGPKLVLLELWMVGRWLLLAGSAHALSIQILLWSLYWAQGPEGMARYQALASVLGLSNPVLLGLGNHLLPSLARWQHELGSLRLSLTRARSVLFLGLILLLPAWGICLIAPAWVLKLVYGSSSPYAALTLELKLFALMTAGGYYAAVVPPVLIGLSLKRWVTLCQLAGLGVCLLTAIPLAKVGGIVGVIFAAALLNVVRVVVSFVAIRRVTANGE